MVTKTHELDYVIAGGSSGFLTRFISQPLDVLKVRFQLQVEPIQTQQLSKYHSLPQACMLIIKEEGLSALWKGHVPAQMLSITYGMAQFYNYHMLTEAVKNFPRIEEWHNLVHFFNGAIAGTMATTLSFPFDTMKTRLIAQSSNHMVYEGMIHSCVSIVRTEKLSSFFRGLTPTLIQIAPNVGCQFFFYEFFTNLYKQYSHQTNETCVSATNSLISGSMAGVLAKTVTYPFDLVRRRMQIQNFEHGRKGFGEFFFCSGMIDCLVRTTKREGIAGLFKGFVPSQLKAAIVSALYFTFYEQSLQFLQLRHE